MAQLDIPRLGDTPSSIPAIRVCQTISWVCCLCILHCMARLDIPNLDTPSSIPAIRVCQTISWICCLCILLEILRFGCFCFSTCNKSAWKLTCIVILFHWFQEPYNFHNFVFMSDQLMSLLFVHLALYGTVRYTKIYPFFNTCNKSMSDHLMSLLFVHLAWDT